MDNRHAQDAASLSSAGIVRREQEESVEFLAGPDEFLSEAQADRSDELVREARRSARLWTGLWGSGVMLLLLCLGIPVARAFGETIPIGALAAIPVLVLIGFAVLYRVRYGQRLALLQRPHRQRTRILVRSQRLNVETSGPFGETALDLVRTQLKDIKLLLDARHPNPLEAPLTHTLAIFTTDGQFVRILHGKPEEALRVIGLELRRILDIRPHAAL